MTERKEGEALRQAVEILWPGLLERRARSQYPHLLDPIVADMKAKASRILALRHD